MVPLQDIQQFIRDYLRVYLILQVIIVTRFSDYWLHQLSNKGYIHTGKPNNFARAKFAY